MTIVRCTDPADPRLAAFLSMTDVELRRALEPETGLFLAEGTLVIQRALAAGHRPLAAVASPRWSVTARELLPDDVPVYELPEALLRELTGYRVHRGALVAFVRPAPLSLATLLDGARRIVVLEDLVDHTNVGAVARSAAGLGYDGMLLSPACADPLYRRSIKVSMGATLTFPFARVATWPEVLDELKANGFRTLALSPAGPVELRDVRVGDDDRIALLFGTEGDGLSRAALARVEETVRIGMRGGVDSLNVAVAAGIALHALQP